MFLYIITAIGTDRPCKVGTSFNPEKRAKTLMTGSPVDLAVYFSEPCVLADSDFGGDGLGYCSPHQTIINRARQVEKAIHRKFADRRIRGEWLDVPASDLQKEIIAEVARARKQHGRE